MPYFKNAELARLYRVSDKTIYNWIAEARQGKLGLTLHEQNGKTFIVNSNQNIALLEDLVEKRKKFRNTRGCKVVTPKARFYEIYSSEQIYDIIQNLDIYREIPREYTYIDGGARNWEQYAERLAREDTPNLLKSTLRLLDAGSGYLDYVMEPYERVNIIDIGVGNGRPVEDLLSRLTAQGKLGRYIGIDISGDMLTIAERNMAAWFGDRVAFEGHVLNINYERFRKILAAEYMRKDSCRTLNVVLLLGSTLCNFRDPNGVLKSIRDSMGANDLFVHTQLLDTERSRHYLNFNLSETQVVSLPQTRFIFDLLNIDDDSYDVEAGFDPERRQRYARVRLKVALSIMFEVAGGRQLVDIEKGESILLWRHWHMGSQDVAQLLERNGFYVMHTSQTTDREYLLTLSQVTGDHALPA